MSDSHDDKKCAALNPDFYDPEMRPFTTRALLAGLISMLFAFLGGLVCARKLSLGI